LADWSGEVNWKSSLRSRAGFSATEEGASDFEYRDKTGALTRHFRRMNHSYITPEWLKTVCSAGNVPLYRLEIKSTTSQDAIDTFYMSGNQYEKVIWQCSFLPEDIGC
jgi:hypothetical protein